eukprot:354622-Chlamydomonas_euryale.AAC.4
MLQPAIVDVLLACGHARSTGRGTPNTCWCESRTLNRFVHGAHAMGTRRGAGVCRAPLHPRARSVCTPLRS